MLEGSTIISSNSTASRSELLVVYGAGIFVSVLAGIFFHIQGYPPVITAFDTLTIISPPIYMIPIFLPFGILLGEVLWIGVEKQGLYLCIVLFTECFLVAGFSIIRYVTGIPVSGHMIILSFYLPHQIITNRRQYPFGILIGFIVLLITMFFKIILWNDLITFIGGLILGIALWILGYVYRLKYIKKDT
ncbi:MAG: hypothetical protein ACXAEU_06535 [Candidatus Hodarchaeales archaeon]